MTCRGCGKWGMVMVLGVAALTGAMGTMAAWGADEKGASNDGEEATPSSFVLGYTMKRIDGTGQDLSEYKGKVVLMVNVASRCGLTPQYEALERLYREKKEQGFVVLGFPANEFGNQEPGSNAEIAEFCTGKYGVSFPMFEKIVVKGEGVHPLYARLAGQPSPIGGEPKWNFTKFLVDRSGNVVARYEPRVKPDDPTLVEKIDELLAQSP